MPKGRPAAPQKLKRWAEAREKYRRGHVQVQMACGLGMNSGKFGGLANHAQEPWKSPLPAFIEECHVKRFGKTLPEDSRPIGRKIGSGK